jgi:hypothetical protein
VFGRVFFSSMWGTWLGVLGWAGKALIFLPFKIMGDRSRYPIFRYQTRFQERIGVG